ncbi:MAG: DUF488 domain-containing protein [Planctomycetaceae bacterium]|nr:DUF488 domain-containing protein [Planctomycetaceae bacterium]
MPSLGLFTIGFARKSAERFFSLLQQAAVRRVVDVRLNNVSQLAGFAKRDDLRFFLRMADGIDYIHLPDLAPTRDILDAYKKHKGDWSEYEAAFLPLMTSRRIESTIAPQLRDGDCLLCSEHEPHQCHRRLIVEYLQQAGWNVTVRHLM